MHLGSGIPPGDYLEFGSELKVKIELARNLLEETKPSVSVIAECQTISEIPEVHECFKCFSTNVLTFPISIPDEERKLT